MRDHHVNIYRSLCDKQKEFVQKQFEEYEKRLDEANDKIKQYQDAANKITAENEISVVRKNVKRQKKDFQSERKQIFEDIKEKLAYQAVLLELEERKRIIKSMIKADPGKKKYYYNYDTIF